MVVRMMGVGDRCLRYCAPSRAESAFSARFADAYELS